MLSTKKIYENPVLLRADLFTSLARTPWAGRKIAQTIKAGIVKDKNCAIGESWEISTDPQMPSTVKNSQQTLAAIIAEYPREMLSDFLIAKNHLDCQILIKLINADFPLSLQVHPRDGDVHLKPNECGKPESWLILEADKGAGVYFGFSKARTTEELRILLTANKFSKEDLQFIPVSKYDYFDIPEGVPHVVATGTIVFEPQRILPHKSGKTYRMWDWNRKYDASGALDMAHGFERELHIAESLELIDPLLQVGPEFGASLKKIPLISQVGKNKITSFPANKFLQTHILDLNEVLIVEQRHGYGCLTCIEGEISFENNEVLKKGESAFIPFRALPLTLKVHGTSMCIYVQPGEVEAYFS